MRIKKARRQAYRCARCRQVFWRIGHEDTCNDCARAISRAHTVQEQEHARGIEPTKLIPLAAERLIKDWGR